MTLKFDHKRCIIHNLYTKIIKTQIASDTRDYRKVYRKCVKCELPIGSWEYGRFDGYLYLLQRRNVHGTLAGLI